MQAVRKQHKAEAKPLAGIVPGGIRKDPSLSPLQKMLCGVINLNGRETSLSNPELADMMNVHEQTIRRNLQALDKGGYIDRKGAGKARRIILSEQHTGDTQGRVYISRALLEDEDLTSAEAYTLARIYGLSTKRGFCTAKSKTLAYEQGVHRSTIEERIISLREKGYIFTTNNTGRRHIHPTEKTNLLFRRDQEKNFDQPPTKTNTPLQPPVKGKKTPVTTNIRNRGNSSTNEKPWQKRAIRYAERLGVDCCDDGYWFLHFRDHDEDTLKAAMEKTENRVNHSGDIENPKGYFIRTVQNIAAGNESEERKDWQKQAVKVADALGVEPDGGWFSTFRDHALEDLRTAWDETTKRKDDVNELKAYFIGVLNKIDSGDLDDLKTEISPRAESLALAKHRNLIQDQTLTEPDSYMAYLFDVKPNVANQAYGHALDVVLNGNANNPLKLFTFYANQIMKGESVQEHKRKRDETREKYKEGAEPEPAYLSKANDTDGTEEGSGPDSSSDDEPPGRCIPGKEESQKQIEQDRREREKLQEQEQRGERIREQFKQLDEPEQRDILEAAREQLPSFLARKIDGPPVEFEEIGAAKYTVTEIYEERYL